jgi:hypothetical protein
VLVVSKPGDLSGLSQMNALVWKSISSALNKEEVQRTINVGPSAQCMSLGLGSLLEGGNLGL